MRLVYVGCKEVGKTVLAALLDFYKKGIACVYTYDAEVGEKFTRKASFDDLMAKHTKIPFRKVRDINDPKVLSEIQSFKPDVIVQFGWSHIIKEDLIKIPPKGCIGFHSSLLPKYRGGSPLNWGIINGEKEWGMTMFYMTPGLDNGDIIAQAKFPIDDDDDCKTLYGKAVTASIEMLKEYLPKMENGTAPRIPQDASKATFVKRRKPEDGRIDWSQPSQKIYNLIRGTTRPFPGAFTWFEGRKIIVWASEKLDQDTSGKEPGKIIGVTDLGPVIATSDRALLLADIEFEDTHDIEFDKGYKGRKLGD